MGKSTSYSLAAAALLVGLPGMLLASDALTPAQPLIIEGEALIVASRFEQRVRSDIVDAPNQEEAVEQVTPALPLMELALPLPLETALPEPQNREGNTPVQMPRPKPGLLRNLNAETQTEMALAAPRISVPIQPEPSLPQPDLGLQNAPEATPHYHGQPESPAASHFRVSHKLGLAKPCAEGSSCLYTWSLATRMGQALRYAEERYGARDNRWTLLGVEFTTDKAPQVWYPSFGGEYGMIVVQLTDEAAMDEKRALFQLAHEVVHLLSPAGPGERASILEEGLATYNSIEFLRSQGIEVQPHYIGNPKYEAAYAIVLELEQQAGDFSSGIKRLRKQNGELSDLTMQDVMSAFPTITAALAEQLSADF